MNKEQLERANLLANSLIPKAERLTMSETTSKGTIGECLYGLLKYDKEFNAKFSQLVSETEQRFRKEFDEL
jgi:uncharacterized protein YdbL (DUF1318 family)